MTAFHLKFKTPFYFLIVKTVFVKQILKDKQQCEMDLGQPRSLSMEVWDSEWSESHAVWKDPRFLLSLPTLISWSHTL